MISTQIKAIIWDIGGVLTPSPHDAIRRYAEELGLEVEDFRTAVLGATDVDTDHPWHKVERGEIDLKAGIEEMRGQLTERGIDADPFGWIGFVRDQVYDTAPLIARIHELADAGMRHAVLTNNVAEFKDGWRKMVPIERFEFVVDSHEVGVRKPDPAIYQLVLDRLGLSAEDTVFLDDTPPNVAAARALGITGIDVGLDPVETLAALNTVVAG